MNLTKEIKKLKGVYPNVMLYITKFSIYWVVNKELIVHLSDEPCRKGISHFLDGKHMLSCIRHASIDSQGERIENKGVYWMNADLDELDAYHIGELKRAIAPTEST